MLLPMTGRSVLVVEDDDDLRGLYRNALSGAGFEVREAGTGLDALLQIDAAPPDVLVLDLMLPKVSGFGVLYDLNAQGNTNRIPVVVVTGTDEEVDPTKASCVLRKPVTPDELIAAIERTLEPGTQPA